jgi:hypothetical protein
MDETTPQVQVRTTPRKKVIGFCLGIGAALLLVPILAVPNPSRFLRTSLECDMTSWGFDHGWYGVEAGGNSVTNEYWEIGPFLVSVPDRDGSMQRID